MQEIAKLLHALLCAEVKSTFYKINVHSAMTPTDVAKQFEPLFVYARRLLDAFQKGKERAKRKSSVKGKNEPESVPDRATFVTVSYQIIIVYTVL